MRMLGTLKYTLGRTFQYMENYNVPQTLVLEGQDIGDFTVFYLRTNFLVDGLFKMLCIDNSSNFPSTV
jgi:hypothetical protein